MVRQKLSKLALYRYRYALAYGSFALALAIMLLVAGFYLPGGLTDTEIRSTLISDNLSLAQLFNLRPEQLLHLPYRLLQAASISFFGISVISIKLPSIILGFVSALGILYLLNIWYPRSVAIIASIIAVTTSQFLLSSQAGQAGILYIFLTVMILISASMIAQRSAYAQIWVIVGFLLAGISLYLPLNVYILIAIFLTALIHPHARHLLLKRARRPVLAAGCALFLIVISPLISGIVKDINLLGTLFGLNEGFTAFGENAAILLQSYGNFMHPAANSLVTPVYSLGIVIVIALGLYRLLSAKYTAKSYLLSFWLVLLIPLVCLNPSFVSITFIPVVLLIALGIDHLISSWYSLFPHNPYARAFGLLPLGVLMVGLVASNIDRYVYGLHYDSGVYAAHNYDLTILSRELSALDKSKTVQLIVPESKLDLYRIFARHQSYVAQFSVSSDITLTGKAATTIVERTLKANVTQTPSRILVTPLSNDADRFYVYKK